MAEDSLKTVLGFEASQAIQTLQQMQTALQGWSTAMANAKAAASAFNNTAKSTQANLLKLASSTQAYAASNQVVVGSFGEIPSAANAASTATAKVSKVTTEAAKATTKAAADVKKSSGAMILSWQSVIRIFVIQAVHQAISKVTGALAESAESARTFEKALAEVQTISGGFFNNLDALAKKAEEFSAATGQSLSTVTEGLYETLSNEVTDAAHSFEFLAAASDFSIASVSSLESSVDLLSSVINSYNLDVSQATTVSGKLFKAIEVGRFRADDLADSIGRVTALTSQMGISLDETLAALSALTQSGMKYNEAYTLITNVSLKLIKPTEELKKVFSELGISTAEAGIQAFGFQGLLKEISKGSGETASELAKVFNQVRGIRGALGLTGDYAEAYVDSLEKIKKAGADTITGAKALIFETNAKQVELEFNKLNIALVNFGRGATTVTKSVFDSFGGAVNTVRTFTTALGAGAATWVLLGTNATASLKTILSYISLASGRTFLLAKAWKTLAASPTFWAVAVAGAVVAVNYALTRAVHAARQFRTDFEAELTGKAKVQLFDYETELTAQKETNNKLLAEIQQYLFKRQQLFTQNASKIKYAEGVLFGGISTQVSDHLGNVTKLFDAFKGKSNELPSVLREIGRETENIKLDIEEWRFDRQLKLLPDTHKIYAELNRSTELRAKASVAASKGETELAKSLNDQAKTRATSALSQADQLQNRGLIRRAEGEVEATLQNELKLQEAQAKQAKDLASAVERMVPAMDKFAAAIKPLAATFEDIVNNIQATTDPLEKTKLLEQLKPIAQAMETLFSDVKITVKLANKAELQKEFQDAIRGFTDPLTGISEPLDTILSESVKRINAALAQTPDVSSQQAIAVALGKQYDEGTVALLKQKDAQQQIDTAIRLSTADYATFVAEVDKAGKLAPQGPVEQLKSRIKEAVVEAQNLAAAGKAGTPEYSAVLNRILEIKKVLTDIETATAPSWIQQGLTLGLIDTTSFENMNQELQKIFDRFIQIGEQQRIVNEQAGAASIVTAVNNQVLLSADPLNAYRQIVENAASQAGTSLSEKISQGMQGGVSAVQSGASAQIQALQAVEAQARQTANALNFTGTVGKALGGYLYRASGGLSKGTDTIPAMLSPGEFVVNANATRRFYSQLVAMNGSSPAYRQSGGTVNNNIGDIKINISESQSAKTTARETISLIKRELRKGTAKL